MSKTGGLAAVYYHKRDALSLMSQTGGLAAVSLLLDYVNELRGSDL
jgi:hypothetical protein